MPKTKATERKVNVSFYIEIAILERIEEDAKSQNKSKAEFLREIVDFYYSHKEQ